MPVKYFAFDVETTGFYPFAGDEILSLAFMLLDENLFCIKKGQWFVNPSEGTYVNPEAAEINGYAPDKWAEHGAISQEELQQKLMFLWESNAVSRAYPLGQNVSFDVNFLDALAHKSRLFHESYRAALAYHKIDTICIGVSLDQAHNVTGAYYRLGELAERWGVELINAHDSLADLEATVGIFRKYHEHLRLAPKPPAVPISSFIEKFSSGWRFRHGKHQRSQIDAVPLSYLKWVISNVVLRPEEREVLVDTYSKLLG